MRSLLAMIKANLKMNVRNRTALFWNLAFPALFILIFGAIFNNGDNVTFDVGVAGQSSDYSAAVTGALKANKAFHVKTGSEKDELKALNDGDRDIVIVFGPPKSGTQPTVTIYYDETEGPNATIATNVIRQVLLGVAQASNPVPITEQAVNSANITFMDFLVPGILAMSVMNAGVIGLSTSFVAYRERGILRRIKVTPFRLSSFILARVLAQLIIAVAQTVILVGLAWLVFGLHLRGNIALIAFMIVLGALAFLAIGFAVSGIANNVETAASYANLITFPMLFLSGVFFDLNNAPTWLKPITKILPLTYLVNGLREPMTRGSGISTIWVDIVVLTGTFVVAMAIAIRFFRWDAQGNG
jgi:ABC-2 type transport system permease protein